MAMPFIHIRFIEVKDQRKITSVIDVNYSFNQNTVLRVRVMVVNATFKVLDKLYHVIKLYRVHLNT